MGLDAKHKACASLPFLPMAKLLVLPKSACSKTAPSDTYVVTVCNRRSDRPARGLTGLRCRTLGKKRCVQQSLYEQALANEPCPLIRPTDGDRWHSSKTVVAKRHAQTRRDLPVFTPKRPATA